MQVFVRVFSSFLSKRDLFPIVSSWAVFCTLRVSLVSLISRHKLAEKRISSLLVVNNGRETLVTSESHEHQRLYRWGTIKRATEQ